MHGIDPLVQRDLGSLQHRADRNGKLLTAAVALDDAGTVCVTMQPRDILTSPQCGQIGPSGQSINSDAGERHRHR